MKKTNITVSIDWDVFEAIKVQNLNKSKICNEALRCAATGRESEKQLKEEIEKKKAMLESWNSGYG